MALVAYLLTLVAPNLLLRREFIFRFLLPVKGEGPLCWPMVSLLGNVSF